MTTTHGTRHVGALGFVIEMELDFPAARERVYQRWTDADALARWFAPPGYATVHSESDPRPGGEWRLGFRSVTGEHQYTDGCPRRLSLVGSGIEMALGAAEVTPIGKVEAMARIVMWWLAWDPDRLAAGECAEPLVMAGCGPLPVSAAQGRGCRSPRSA